MMDVREKLVELLREAPYNIFGNKLGNCYFDSCLGLIADHLIANGATVQEFGHWVTLEDCSNEGVYCSVCHKKVYRHDYALCNRKNKLRSDYCPHCGAKMLPQPPKGE